MLYISRGISEHSRFFVKFLVLSRCSYFVGKFQAISRPGQIIFKSPGFPGFQVPLGTLQIKIKKKEIIGCKKKLKN